MLKMSNPKVYPTTRNLEDVFFMERRRLGMLDDLGESGRICWQMIEAVGEYEHGADLPMCGDQQLQLPEYAAVVGDLILIILNQA